MDEIIASNLISSLTRKFAQELITPQIHVQIDEANIFLVAIMRFLNEVDSKRKYGDRISPWVREIRDLAYFTEDSIDIFLATVSQNQEKNLKARVLSLFVQLQARIEFAYQIKHISEKTREIFQSSSELRSHDLVANSGDEITLSPRQPLQNRPIQFGIFGSESASHNLIIVQLARVCKTKLIRFGRFLSGLANCQSHSLGADSNPRSQLSEVIAFDDHEDGIATSYQLLPSFLQPCFLYLASFPKDNKISARSIVKIWIAEGFIPQERRGIPEDIAEGYIEHLVLRSMVEVTDWSMDGAVKYFRVLPVCREMAIHEAQETSFLMINPRENTNGDINKPRRAAFHGVGDISMGRFPRLRAILAFQVSNLTAMKFKFIRVMELCGSRDLHYLPKGLKYMILLRYLGLRNTGIIQLPNSIGDLLNLQTLDIRNTEIKHIPKSLWNINTLRHVQVLPHKVQGPPPSAHLQNLQTIGMITTPKAWAKGSPCVPKLRKFQIDHPENLNWNIIVGLLRKLDHLISLRISSSGNIPNEIVDTAPYECHPHIQHLHLIGVWSSNIGQPCNQLPPNLTKLVLDSSRIVEDPMPTLEKLRSLRILRLARDAITVKEIVCSARGFPKLQHLELNNLTNLEKWTVEEHAMPMLNYLCLKKCPHIEILPELQHVTTLKKLKLDGMPPHFVIRVQNPEGADWHKREHISEVSITPCAEPSEAN